MSSYEDFHRRSIEDPEGFWGEQAQMIYWHKPPQKVRDYSKPPFCKWFVGGETNLCYNAVDVYKRQVQPLPQRSPEPLRAVDTG